MKVSYARIASGRQSDRHLDRDENRHQVRKAGHSIKNNSDRKSEKFDKRCTRLALASY